jgi:hypothetical protein
MSRTAHHVTVRALLENDGADPGGRTVPVG